MASEQQKQLVQHWLANQSQLGRIVLIGWFMINALVLSTSTYMEYSRSGHPIPYWQPLCWELSSISVILLLIPAGIWINDRWLSQLGFRHWLVANLLLSLPFSMVHVAAMVSLRKLCYWALADSYDFSRPLWEFGYEYHKDIQTYFTLILIIYSYRLLMRRLHGEASYLANGDTDLSKAPDYLPERLLIKKLGREFLIEIKVVEWVEAAGNYANLHSRDSVYPMRITMEKLANLLPAGFVRIHRSSIVNLNFVKEIRPLDTGDYEILLLSGKKLSLSRRYRDGFKSGLNFIND